MGTSAVFKNIKKEYDGVPVIEGLNLEIYDGELFTLLGPSGCGKTTLLRMVAGFNTIEGGEIFVNDRLLNNLPAHKRNMGMVFQNYAIFPHLSVFENVAYGLKARKYPKEKIRDMVKDILDVVHIGELAERSPKNMSGGQQQRVALARAIVIEPTMLLMDEPLSNLDAKLRIKMRKAIKEIQTQLGITTIYVTHDQEEALAISDRIAVMMKGEIQQVGKPKEIYSRPSNTFVASFIGHSNFIKCQIKGKNTVKFNENYSISLDLKETDETEIQIAVRPEEFNISIDKGLKAEVVFKTFLGSYVHYNLKMENGIEVEYTEDIISDHADYDIGDSVFLTVDEKRVNAYTLDGSSSLIPGVK